MSHADDLEGAGFVRVPSVTAPSGVYCLLKAGEVVYVGKSRSVFTRLGQHRMNQDRKKKKPSALWLSPGEPRALDIKFDEAMVFFCPIGDLDHLELEYIRRFRPKWNIQVRQPLPDYGLKVDITALAAQMQWKLKSTESSLDSLRRRSL